MSTLADRTPNFAPHNIYAYDTGLCALAGLVLIALAEPLTDFLGWGVPASHMIGAGIVLMPWALYNYITFRLRRVTITHMIAHIVGDGGWVLLTVALLLVNSAQMTGFGVTILLVQALAVCAVIATKLLAFRTA